MTFELKDPQNNPLLNPVDYFNICGSWETIFEGAKGWMVLSDASAGDNLVKPCMELVNGMVRVVADNPLDIATGSLLTKFMALTAVRFKGQYSSALTYVSHELMGKTFDYIRVGTNYFKITRDRNRWGVPVVELEPWKKEELKLDFSYDKMILHRTPKFDKFVIVPDNKNHQPYIGKKYNDYKPFPHKPCEGKYNLGDIPHTLGVIRNVFGDKCRDGVNLGFLYMQILYLYPKQILPILTLVSRKRETGKTTFLNWITMLFADNTVNVTSQVLTSDFTSTYATKNIIMIDEAVHEKSHAVEKLKFLSTAKTMIVDTKHIIPYTVPFFGKIIMCTNKEKDFIRIDEEEIRFWVRKIEVIQGKKNTNIESDLFLEIPIFLNILESLPIPDLTLSRHVFTQEETHTTALEDVKNESRSGLRKDLEMYLEEWFMTTGKEYLEATILELKEHFFSRNQKIDPSYLAKVIRDEMGLKSYPKKHASYFKEGFEGVKQLKRVFRFDKPQDLVTDKTDIEDPF